MDIRNGAESVRRRGNFGAAHDNVGIVVAKPLSGNLATGPARDATARPFFFAASGVSPGPTITPHHARSRIQPTPIVRTTALSVNSEQTQNVSRCV